MRSLLSSWVFRFCFLISLILRYVESKRVFWEQRLVFRIDLDAYVLSSERTTPIALSFRPQTEKFRSSGECV